MSLIHSHIDLNYCSNLGREPKERPRMHPYRKVCLLSARNTEANLKHQYSRVVTSLIITGIIKAGQSAFSRSDGANLWYLLVSLVQSKCALTSVLSANRSSAPPDQSEIYNYTTYHILNSCPKCARSTVLTSIVRSFISSALYSSASFLVIYPANLTT